MPWQFIGVAILSVATILFTYYVKPPTPPETTPAGSTGDSLLSHANLEYAGLILGIIGGGALIYSILFPTK